MIKLAFVGGQFAEQVKTNSRDLTGVAVSVSDSLEEFERQARSLRPKVVVVSLKDLGEPPLPRLDRILGDAGADLAVVVYSYARRETVDALARHPKTRVVQGPLSLGNLRVQMLDLIVGDILDVGGGRALVACPRCGSRVEPAALSSRS